jgi:hypothetical protein
MATQDLLAVDPDIHAMRHSLRDYIDTKIHADIKSKTWLRIVVKGLYQRSGGAHIFTHEKTDKIFNWHRPTTIVKDDSTLVVACFPGRDYVQHYYWLITLHLSFCGNDHTVVELDLPPHNACLDIFLESNLGLMGDIHTVILGYTQQILEEGVGWETGTANENQLFSWHKIHTPDDREVAYLGCLVSFWGDISGQLIHALQKLNKVNCVLYIGKAGSLHAEDHPNQVIATNGSSFIQGQLLSWNSVLCNALDEVKLRAVHRGVHVNVVSPLEESFTWLSEWKGKADYVDCEVGHIALACLEQQTSFGYLHIISDNVAKYYPQNLADERDLRVTEARKKLFSQIRAIISIFLGLNSK